jgi:Major Facilitator Superfamily
MAQMVGSLISQQGSERHQILNSIGVLRYMFFVDGTLSIITSLIAFAALPDYPAISRGFTRRERELATVRLIKRGQDTGSSACRGVERLSVMEGIMAAIRDPRVHVISIVAVLVSAAASASHMLLPSTIQTGYSSGHAHRFAIPTYLVTMALVNIVAWTSDRTRDRRWHLYGALGLAVIGAVFASAMPAPQAIKTGFVMLFTSGIWSAVPLTLTWAAVSIRAPAEKRAVVLGVIHAVSGASCVFGVQMWPRMFGNRQYVAAIMSITFLVLASAVAYIVPEFVSLDDYRGTRAERDQALRRKNMEQVEDILEYTDN